MLPGWMPQAGGLGFVPCPAAAPVPEMPGMAHHHLPKHDDASGKDCPFGAAGQGALDAPVLPMFATPEIVVLAPVAAAFRAFALIAPIHRARPRGPPTA